MWLGVSINGKLASFSLLFNNLVCSLCTSLSAYKTMSLCQHTNARHHTWLCLRYAMLARAPADIAGGIEVVKMNPGLSERIASMM